MPAMYIGARVDWASSATFRPADRPYARGMRIAVLGAGIMGTATSRLLARHDDVDLLILDADGDRAERVVRELGRGEARGSGIGDRDLPGALAGADAVAACIPYRLNLDAMEAALAAGVPYADLGGLFHMTLRQLELDRPFRDARVPAVVGIGCCPGISNVLARLAADRLDGVDSIDIVDGAVEGDSGFGVPYSADTILDEFTRPAMVFESGALREVPAASGAIRHRFPEPVGEMDAVYTLHSEPATLPRTIEGVRDVRWRLALPPKVAEGFRLLVDLGLASDEPTETASGTVTPRDLLRTLLDRLPSPTGAPEDVEILEVVATGKLGSGNVTFTGRATFEPTAEGIGAGAFGTSIPMAVAVRWLAGGRVPAGVHPPETAFAAEEFLADLELEGVRIDVSVD
jgi:saccharopine dehydrogenase-like NADP-dependent oxidoreductase